MKKSSAAHSDLDDKTIALIDSIAGEVRNSIEHGTLPDLKLPVRSLDNVSYDEAKGYFELGDARKVRSLTVNTARAFAQTLRLMARQIRTTTRRGVWDYPCGPLPRPNKPTVVPSLGSS